MRLREILEEHRVPHGVALVARGDAVDVATVGGVRRDSLFRIASIGKPITAAALMLVVQESVVGLDDPIATWLPELAAPQVLRTPQSELDDVVPAAREVTVRDVLESRAGWGFPADFSVPAVGALFAEATMLTRTFASVDEWLAGLARVPLLAQPGAAWLYNTCSDLQGALVERASGLPFARVVHERVLAPLEMVDTAFHVAPAKRARLAPYDGDPAMDRFDEEPGFASGAAGLVSTADDWLAFGRMLLAEGRPLLTPESLRLMTSDHMTPEQRDASTIFLEGAGWGYGGSVAGPRYGWVGGSGTTAHVDFASGTVAVLLTQQQMPGPTPTPLMRAFWAAAFAG